LKAAIVLLAALVGVAGGAILLLFLFQRRLIYPAPRANQPVIATGFQSVTLVTSDGMKLAALYRPASGGRPTIVFFHGNGDSLRGSLAATEVFAREGFGLLLPEYRGYGVNPGEPSEAGLYADGRAALAFLSGAGVSPAATVVIGNSLGSGVATQLASETILGGLVIVSGYSSLPDAAADMLGTRLVKPLVRDRFDNIAKLPKLGLPILILHGDADRTISVAQGRALHAAAAGSEYREYHGAGHQLAYGVAAQHETVAWFDRRAR
jgi:fermentation-respiration switch protein FrsA (DUF1100 family)